MATFSAHVTSITEIAEGVTLVTAESYNHDRNHTGCWAIVIDKAAGTKVATSIVTGTQYDLTGELHHGALSAVLETMPSE